MIFFESDQPLEWGALDLPLLALTNDWHGKPMEPTPGFAVACDPLHLWFVANHRAPASAHPKSRPGGFQSELWKHDVAELFLANPTNGRYLELNLAPNAAWWNCEFSAPRKRTTEEDIAMPDIHTWSDLAPDGSWVAAMAIPLDILRARIGFDADTRVNVCMILGSPEQKFLSAVPLGAGEPDFHRPQHFVKPRRVPLSSIS